MLTANTTHVPEDSLPWLTPILSDAVKRSILWYMTFVITPCISLFGIVGNCISVVILFRDGLRKSSNMLLISLAVADTSYLMGYNNIPRMFYDFGDLEGFEFGTHASRALYVIYNVFEVLDWGGGCVSFTLPMLITIERLVAIFSPLKFSVWVTPRRVGSAVLVVYVFWYFLTAYTRLWFQLSFISHSFGNGTRTVAIIERSSLYSHQLEAAGIIQEIIVYLANAVPLSIVVSGCVAISVKLRLTHRKREKMTSSKSASTSAATAERQARRTTKTLLAVCAVYSVTCLACFLPQYIPQYMYYTLYADAPHNLAVVLYRVMNLFMCLNSSSNFIIYIAMNKRFRDAYKQLFKELLSLKRSS